MPDKINHRFHRMIQESFEYQETQRKRADKAWNYHDGVQWTKDEINALEDRCQQASVINICAPTINGLAAVEAQRRTDYLVVGRDVSDDVKAKVLTILIKQVFSRSSFNYFLGHGFREGAITGISFFEVVPEEDPDSGDLNIMIKKRRWEEFYYDPFSTMPDLTDARFISREVWFDVDVLMETYPDHTADIESAYSDGRMFTGSFHGQEEEAQGNHQYNYVDHKNRRMAVHEMYYRDSRLRVRHVIFTGNVFLKGSLEGENPSPFAYNYVPFVPFIALRDKKGRPIGVLDFILDIQDAINKAHSKHLHYVSSNQVIAEKPAILDPDELRYEVNRPNGVVLLKDGGLARFKFRDHLQESVHMMTMIEFLVQMAQRISGINDALIGIGGTNARSALQESSRISQGVSMQSPVIENLYFTKKQITTIVMKMIGEFYTNKRAVRIVGPGGAEEIIQLDLEISEDGSEVVMDEKPFSDIINVISYDVELKEDLPFTSAREATNMALTEIIKSIPGLSPALVPVIIENMPLQNKNQVMESVSAFIQGQQAAGPPLS